MTLKQWLVASMTFVSLLSSAYAAGPATTRHQLLSNDKTKVWEAVIYPGKHQELSMHRHDYPRVLIALNDGMLKITNDKGESRLLKLNQGKAYFFPRDTANELHTDENLSQHAMKMFVVELRDQTQQKT